MAFRLRLVGYSDWNLPDVRIYLDPRTFAKAQLDVGAFQRLRSALADHLSALVTHVFLGYKPARPSQSRWTGVAHVCQWSLGLALFHRILKPLLSALSMNASSENSADPASRSMDVDVCDWVNQSVKSAAEPSLFFHVDSDVILKFDRTCFFFKWCVCGCAVAILMTQVQTADSDSFRAQQNTRRQLLGQWWGFSGPPAFQIPESESELEFQNHDSDWLSILPVTGYGCFCLRPG